MKRYSLSSLRMMLLATGFILGGCTTYVHTTADADIGYVNVASLPEGSNNINPIRLQALEETASTLGARGALAFRSDRINKSLEKQANYLDQVFDFNQLLLRNNV